MTVRVMLISPAMNSALRDARFEADAPLDEAGARSAAAAAAAGAVPAADHRAHGPSVPCRQTAEALGLAGTTGPAEPALPESALRDWDMGRWRGRRLSEVSAAEPDAVAAWLTDPSAAPHGGESLLDLTTRVGTLLDSPAWGVGRRLAVVEPAVVRAAMVHALGLPMETFWRLDVAPLTLTELSGRSGRWNLRCGRPLGR
ncbi:histidine phosphatase family protein [Streptomyces sp. NBC_01102]|uniref:histidine phosphatase family protein n=1 Tax=unclassified Streptomyces TaxID=2593676 RepID=UPI00386A8ECD|nr:histidine phosphatase family protein [Streptomyces sp. NBC_01102]